MTSIPHYTNSLPLFITIFIRLFITIFFCLFITNQEALEDETLRANALADQIVLADLALAAEREGSHAELAAEHARASDEGEDLIQEMAELRFRLTELVQQERELRAQAEGASLQRVQELEAQVGRAGDWGGGLRAGVRCLVGWSVHCLFGFWGCISY